MKTARLLPSLNVQDAIANLDAAKVAARELRMHGCPVITRIQKQLVEIGKRFEKRQRMTAYTDAVEETMKDKPLQ